MFWLLFFFFYIKPKIRENQIIIYSSEITPHMEVKAQEYKLFLKIYEIFLHPQNYIQGRDIHDKANSYYCYKEKC